MISEKKQHISGEIIPEHQNRLEGNFTIAPTFVCFLMLVGGLLVYGK